jgi:hypothetical protein
MAARLHVAELDLSLQFEDCERRGRSLAQGRDATSGMSWERGKHPTT